MAQLGRPVQREDQLGVHRLLGPQGAVVVEYSDTVRRWDIAGVALTGRAIDEFDQAIARDLKQPLEEIYEAAKVIMDFDPRPGRQYASDDAHYITPDVYIHKVGDKFFVVPNDDGLPKLKISNFYKAAMGNGAASKDYVQDKLRSAQWLSSEPWASAS